MAPSAQWTARYSLLPSSSHYHSHHPLPPSQIKAVQQAVADVEGTLKSISDDILDETCKVLVGVESANENLVIHFLIFQAK